MVMSDPIGDAPPNGRIASSPDLSSATVDVDGGNVTFEVQFAAGTVDAATTWVRIELDTDRSSATGNRERNGMGSDFDLLIVANGKAAAVQKYNPSGCAGGGVCSTTETSVPMTFVGDTLQVSVPLSMIGNTDGHMFVLVKTWPVVGQESLVNFTDEMPDSTLPPGRI
jgi:hypothetical protein